MFSFLRKNHPVDPPDIRLMKAVKFIDKDLKANRSGVMTEAQRKRIQRGQVWGALFLWIVAVGFAFPVVFMATGHDWQTEPGVWIMGLLSLFFVALAFWEQNKTKNILINNQVDSVSGFLSRRIDMVYTGKVFVPIHKITVDKKDFTVGDKVYNSFVEGEQYTIYYVAGTEKVLSAELVYDAEKEKRLEDTSAEMESLEIDETQSESLSL